MKKLESNSVKMCIRKTIQIFLAFYLWSNSMMAQDYSQLGKKINYSDTYKKAKKISNIYKALKVPEQVTYLKINVLEDGENYLAFVKNHSKFINLRKLIIDNGFNQINIETFPDLSVFKKLEFLQIFVLPGINLNNLDSLSDLKYLEANGCEIISFPNSLLSLKKLECLNLSVNYLNILPDSIGVLTNLKELELTNNCFQEIPKQVAEIKGLLYLTMNNAETAGEFRNGKWFCKNKLNSYPLILKECRSIKKIGLCKVDQETKDRLKKDFPGVKFSFSK